MSADISVIISHYNRPGYLKQAIRSVIYQTLRPKEIIVVDDSSRWEQQEKAKRICRQFGVRFISRNFNGGPSAARNDGIQASTAEWIQILDSDDCLTRNSLQVRLSVLSEKKDALWIAGQTAMAEWFLAARLSESPTLRYLPWFRWEKERVIEPFAVPQEDPFKVKWVHCAILFHRSLFRKYGLYDETLRHGEDKELRWRFHHFSQTLPLVVDDIVYIIRHGHERRLSAVTNHESVLEQIEKRRSEGLTSENTKFLNPERFLKI